MTDILEMETLEWRYAQLISSRECEARFKFLNDLRLGIRFIETKYSVKSRTLLSFVILIFKYNLSSGNVKLVNYGLFIQYMQRKFMFV